MQLKDICVLDVACCTPDVTTLEAARLMRKHHVGDLVVVEDDAGTRVPMGIITDRDIVVQVLGMDLDPSKTRVCDVMSSHLVLADDAEEVSAAVARMQAHGVRRVPVTGANGDVVGIFSLDDLLQLQARQAKAVVDIVDSERVHEQRLRR
jgi:CBS domain-containing protein